MLNKKNEYSEQEFRELVKLVETKSQNKVEEKQKLKERITMKRVLLMIAVIAILLTIIFTVSCSAQTNPYFRVTWQPNAETAEYLVFMETVNVGSASRLVQGMDYLDPVSVQDLYWVTVLTGTTTTRFRSPADGKELHVGVVVKKASGYYGAMAKTFLTKDTAPGMVNGLTITKE